MSDYINIGYNKNLDRNSSDTGMSTSGEELGIVDVGTNPATGGIQNSSSSINSSFDLLQGTIIGNNLEDLWITSFIKSKNYKPKKQGFLLDGVTGYIEAMDLYISGSIVGGSLDIPDTTTDNSFHVDTDGNQWSGCNVIDFNANHDNATTYILKTGVAKFQSVILTSAVTLQDLVPGSEISIQEWQHNLTFSATNYRIIAWTSGTITLMDGTTYTINAGNTGNLSALTYIYLDIGTSTTILQVTTTASIAVGSGKIIIGVAQNVVDTSKYATFQIFGGRGGVGGTFVGSDNIAANAVTANEIFVNNLAAINADMGTITAGTITIDTAGYIRGGQVDFATGSGWFIGYSGGAHKFSVGTPTNYLTFDGTYVRIAGNLDLTSIFNNISYTVANLPIPPTTEGFKSPTAYEY